MLDLQSPVRFQYVWLHMFTTVALSVVAVNVNDSAFVVDDSR